MKFVLGHLDSCYCNCVEFYAGGPCIPPASQSFVFVKRQTLLRLSTVGLVVGDDRFTVEHFSAIRIRKTTLF
jgi:hypothetical protein